MKYQNKTPGIREEKQKNAKGVIILQELFNKTQNTGLKSSYFENDTINIMKIMLKFKKRGGKNVII